MTEYVFYTSFKLLAELVQRQLRLQFYCNVSLGPAPHQTWRVAVMPASEQQKLEMGNLAAGIEIGWKAGLADCGNFGQSALD